MPQNHLENEVENKIPRLWKSIPRDPNFYRRKQKQRREPEICTFLSDPAEPAGGGENGEVYHDDDDDHGDEDDQNMVENIDD